VLLLDFGSEGKKTGELKSVGQAKNSDKAVRIPDVGVTYRESSTNTPPVLYLLRNEIYGGQVALGHTFLVKTQSSIFKEPIDLLDESVEFGRVLLRGGLLAEFEPSFFGVALHGAYLQHFRGLANLQNIMMDAAVRLSFFFPLRREKASHCLLW
jgi:hypothetical protein